MVIRLPRMRAHLGSEMSLADRRPHELDAIGGDLAPVAE